MKKYVSTMQYSKSTKGTHVYKNDADDAIVKTLYVSKDRLPSVAPDTIVVTVAHDSMCDEEEHDDNGGW